MAYYEEEIIYDNPQVVVVENVVDYYPQPEVIVYENRMNYGPQPVVYANNYPNQVIMDNQPNRVIVRRTENECCNIL